MIEQRNFNAENNKLAVTLGTYGHTDERSVSISHGSLEGAATLTFERTLRVPDNSDVNSLPPSIGQFPLYSVADYKQRMPEDMASKGGLFLPMYQREAMWIRFSAKEPFALKIYVGGVNAISGIPINETPETMLKRLKLSDKVKQDYVNLPEQPWLDGIASEDGNIRQFVAMPKGSGYSVEQQITGEDKIGGLQFEITPVKRSCPVSMTVKSYARGFEKKTLNLHEKGLGDMSTMLDLKKVIEQEFDIKVVSQGLSLETPSFTSTYTTFGADNSTFSDNWISEDHVLVLRDITPVARDTDYAEMRNYSAYSIRESLGGGGTLEDDSFTMQDAKRSDNVGMVASFGVAAPPPPPGAPAFQQQMQLSVPPISASPSMKMSMSKSRKSGPMSMFTDSAPASQKSGVSRRRSGIGPSVVPSTPAPILPPAPKVEAMSLAAGGLIRQSINVDNYPASIWDTAASILFNVQLLNSESFVAVTGRAPPSSPVDAKMYAQHGFAFYDIWNEKPTGIKGDFDAVKSVGAIDESKANDKSSFWKKLGGTPKGESAGEFQRDESLKFPVIMLDFSHRKTFKPLKQMEEEAAKLKSQN